MKQSKLGLLTAIRGLVETQRLLEEGESADDVGMNEVARALDRTVDMALGRQIHHCVWSVLVEQPPECRPIADVHHFERVTRMPFGLGNRLQIGRISKFVD